VHSNISITKIDHIVFGGAIIGVQSCVSTTLIIFIHRNIKKM